MDVDAALGCVAVEFEFETVVVVGFGMRGVVGGRQGRETESGALEVDEGLQCRGGLGILSGTAYRRLAIRQMNGYELTSLLLAIQLLTTSGVNSSATTFFSLLSVQAGPLLTTPMLGPNRASCFFFSGTLSTAGAASTPGPIPCMRAAMAVAVREVLVSDLAR
jgi:hypothetical protein